MGVPGLWDILSELPEEKYIKYLRGKRVAVDLSGWVVQATKFKGLRAVKNPHLRNLFFRVSALLLNDVHPIFVLEGKVPELKKAVFKKRNYQGNNNSDNASRESFDKILNQCHELLKSLGVSCIKSSGEAEALCALLCAKGIVDGVITNDSDAFLYGAHTVYRDFSIDKKGPNIKLYSLKSEKKLQLNQRNLIALALLLGCDFGNGVPKVGKKTALELLKELEGYDLLQRFQDWKQKSESELFPGYETDIKKKGTHCKNCSHLGSTTKHRKEGCGMCDSKISCKPPDSKNPCICSWHKNNDARQKHKNELKVYTAAKSIPDFPNAKVIEEFLKFSDEIPGEDVLDWKCPDLKQIQGKLFDFLGWTFEYSFEKCFPIITSWQQFKMSRNCLTDKITLLYKPINRIQSGESKNNAFYCACVVTAVGHTSKLDIVTNMESRFPATLVLWLGREFYRDKYGVTGSSQAWTPDPGDKLGDKFGDEIWNLKGAGIFSISLLGEEIRLNVVDDSM
ncbi:Flap endonuclease GEN 1 [Araneus ventricosus]|uniref:Flap endonuclease GEN 1 n=1 Tax=Araneus ventricosus TaxID=182803 RepID=A0A4Y2GSL8_ARAVE|nr:Flap endonuclease GEN 1 [Araneus ventricosus]